MSKKVQVAMTRLMLEAAGNVESENFLREACAAQGIEEYEDAAIDLAAGEVMMQLDDADIKSKYTFRVSFVVNAEGISKFKIKRA
jgi:hypothetical protein